MSPYLVVFLVVAAAAVIEFVLREKGITLKWIWVGLLILITASLCFRYGQGTDYPTYQYIFESRGEMSWTEVMTDRLNAGWRGEWLFYIVCSALGKAGAPFQLFLIIIAIAEMLLTYRFICRYAGAYECTALMLLYPGCVLIYEFSAVRQGLTMLMFLGLLLPCIERKKWIRYYLLSTLCLAIHSVAVLFFLLPLFLLIKKRWMEIAVIGSFVFMIIMSLMEASVPDFPGTQISILTILHRMVICGICVVLYYRLKERTEFHTNVYIVVLSATAICFILSIIPQLSSRFFEAIRYADIILIVAFLSQQRRKLVRMLFTIVLLVYAFGLTVKNIDASINQGYKAEVKWWNYPYISIIHPERLDEYTIDPKELGL